MGTVLQNLAIEALQTITPFLSNAVRELLVEGIEELEELAQETENEYDDALVIILRAAVDVEKGDQN